MTAASSAPKLRSFGDGSAISKSYRRYLGRASVTMFALILVSAYLLPLLYMVTTAFQQPGQASTPGSPVYPAAPLTGTYQGEAFPIYAVPIDGTVRNLMLIEKGRESSVFVDPAALPLDSRRRSRTSRPPGRSSTSRGCCSTRRRSRSSARSRP